MFEYLIELLHKDLKLDADLSEYLSYAIVFVSLFLLSFLANLIAKKIILKILTKIIKKTKTNWDDILLEKKVFNRLSHIAPAIVIFFFSFFFTDQLPDIVVWIQKLSYIYIITISILVLHALSQAITEIYRTFKIASSKPIKGYVQIAMIFIYLLGAILIISILLDINPWNLIAGLGAMTAVLLLLFKDTILGFVSSIQIAANNMVNRGDWVEMPKFQADGDVIDISLHTVKIQNWDKTITTIPTYAFISDSFKNWRGMTDAGGRRIKRSINIDMNSIKFCSNEMIEKFKKMELLKDYIDSKLSDIEQYNQDIDSKGFAEPTNKRRLTNVGTFRAYIKAYLDKHPYITKEMTFLVRQLAPTEQGLPIEIYVFCTDTRWVSYEEIQADIFDHFFSILPEFELKVFQNPSGTDFNILTKNT